MGRYIGIGIHYQTELRSAISPRDVGLLHNVYSPDLYDFSQCLENGLIRIKSDISGNELYRLRKDILDFCDYPLEREGQGVEYEKDLMESLSNHSADTLEEVFKKHYYTFNDYNQGRNIAVEYNHSIPSDESFILIYMSWFKFYPSEFYLFHEITILLEKLIHYHLQDNKLQPLVRTFVTL